MNSNNSIFGNRRGVAISRGTVVAGVVLALVAVFYFFIIPALKEKFIGASFQVIATPIMAFEANDIPYKGETVSRTVVSLEIRFPMGRAPGGLSELEVTGDDGQAVPVSWPPTIDPESGDLPEKAITRWVIKEAYFPIGFKQGKLRNKYGDLCVFRLNDVLPAATPAQ